MTEKRMKEIALLYTKYKARQESFSLNSDLKRQVGNTAKAIGITFKEAWEFTETILREAFNETFAKKS